MAPLVRHELFRPLGEPLTVTDSGIAAHQEDPARQRPWRTLFLIAIGTMMVAVDGTIVVVANPAIGASLGATLGELQWVTHGYLLGVAVCLITGGKLADRFGYRRLYLIGVTGFVVASVAIALSQGVGMLIGLRVVQGVFGAALMPAALGMVRTTFPGSLLPRAIGWFAGVIGTGTAIGPILGGVLVSSFGWEAVFYVNVPIGLTAVLLGMRLLPRNRATDPGSRFDVPGVALLIVATFSVVLAVVLAPERGWGDAVTLTLLLSGIAVGGLFVWWQTRASHPLMPMGLFRSASLSLGVLLTLCLTLGMFGALFFLALYMQNVHGLTPMAAGAQLMPLSAALAIGPPIFGRLIGRFGIRVLVPMGFAFAATALFGMSTVDKSTGVLLLSVWLLLLGAGLAVVMSGVTQAVISSVPERLSGVAGGLQQTMMQLGGSLGTAILGALVATRVGSALPGELAAAGAPVSGDLAAQQSLVAQGQALVPPGTGPGMAAAITEASHNTFISGMSLAFLVSGVVLTVAAGLSLLLRDAGYSEGTTVAHV